MSIQTFLDYAPEPRTKEPDKPAEAKEGEYLDGVMTALLAFPEAYEAALVAMRKVRAAVRQRSEPGAP